MKQSGNFSYSTARTETWPSTCKANDKKMRVEKRKDECRQANRVEDKLRSLVCFSQKAVLE